MFVPGGAGKKLLDAGFPIVLRYLVLSEGPKRKPWRFLVMWEKPAYEIVETCCEISAYVYTK